jgi:transposase-like protein
LGSGIANSEFFSSLLKGQDGEVQISVPRDRDGSFEPELVKKGQTRIDGMDDKIIHCPAGDCVTPTACFQHDAICRAGVSMPLV